MASYAVLARIDRVDPHLAGWTPAIAPDWPLSEPVARPEAIDLIGRSPGTAMAERWAHVREVWAQTTFYLFNANSWR